MIIAGHYESKKQRHERTFKRGKDAKEMEDKKHHNLRIVSPMRLHLVEKDNVHLQKQRAFEGHFCLYEMLSRRHTWKFITQNDRGLKPVSAYFGGGWEESNVRDQHTTTLDGPQAYPGSRYGAASWLDSNTTVWIFGGKGYGIKKLTSARIPIMDELWSFDIKKRHWNYHPFDNESGNQAETTAVLRLRVV
ncbi:hypothetical protein OS493_024937 [Desmophyllum pertusum]|uniref:Kelch repeat-containing protein n=1 Tax=Desmophyllum pertusum TaxID=174260 RepID=A0A9W9YLD8_9CNID|nr:hypothetical protein OS493_024937 [Desmophyllum pertusum]